MHICREGNPVCKNIPNSIILQRKRQKEGKKASAKRAVTASAVEHEGESEAESDGYGEEGLSWEAILATVQVHHQNHLMLG